ncbi:MAG: AgmX/PglI C-terminal domain-containing protein [Bdellovibrionota bacterium]
MSITDRVFIRVYLAQDLVEVFQSGESQIVIGSEGEAHLKLKGSDISSVHALIEKRQDGFYICDLGSQSGTFKNGQQVLDDRINSGEEIKIGGYRLEFFIGLPKPVSAGPAASVPKVPEPPKVIPVSAPKAVPQVPKPAPVVVAPVAPKETPSVHKVEKPVSLGGVEKHEPYVQPTGLKGTYAPPSEIKNLSEQMRPVKGTVVEVTVAWNERILDTYHFDSTQVVTIGSSPKNTISIPVFDNTVSHPLVKIDSQVRVLITPDMNGEVRVNETVTTINDLILQGKLPREGAGYAIPLDQTYVIRIDLGSGVSVYVRFVAATPKAIAAPFLLLATSEIATLLSTVMFFGILGIYFAIYTPDAPEEPPVEEIVKKAAFVYDRPKQRVDLSEEAKSAESATEAFKDQEKAPSRGEEGAASAAMPNKSQSTVKKPTTPNPGTGKGVVKATTSAKAKPDSSAKSKAPDPTKQGIFSAFGSKGFNDQLSKTYSGSGNLAGAAGQATGTGGQAALGAGNTPGTGLKDIGAGGEGTATYGIAGVNTKGRGGGVSGYGTGGLGAKGRASVVPGGEGETFSGSIDREAIRRVIRENQRQITACYEKTLNKNPNLYGKVILEWVIVGNGRVSSARVSSSTLKNSEVEQCILSRLRTWKFPEPPPDQEAVVSYPFLFNAQ